MVTNSEKQCSRKKKKKEGKKKNPYLQWVDPSMTFIYLDAPQIYHGSF